MYAPRREELQRLAALSDGAPRGGRAGAWPALPGRKADAPGADRHNAQPDDRAAFVLAGDPR